MLNTHLQSMSQIPAHTTFYVGKANPDNSLYVWTSAPRNHRKLVYAICTFNNGMVTEAADIHIHLLKRITRKQAEKIIFKK